QPEAAAEERHVVVGEVAAGDHGDARAEAARAGGVGGRETVDGGDVGWGEKGGAATAGARTRLSERVEAEERRRSGGAEDRQQRRRFRGVVAPAPPGVLAQRGVKRTANAPGRPVEGDAEPPWPRPHVLEAPRREPGERLGVGRGRRAEPVADRRGREPGVVAWRARIELLVQQRL